jgi:glycopeptide antibiotics resistance protein
MEKSNNTPLNKLVKIALILYVIFLAWFVLCKLNTDLSFAFADTVREINLFPFGLFSDTGVNSLNESIRNFEIFIPLGLLLGAVFKKLTFWRKVSMAFILSLFFEIIQFIFAIGVSDVSDLITNTLGGLLGIKLYDLIAQRIGSKKVDWAVAIIGIGLIVACVILRVVVFGHIRYR